MFQQTTQESFFERVLSNLFPPRWPTLHRKNDLPESLEYHGRKSRTGVDNSPLLAVGRVVGKAQPRRVFAMGPRTSWI